MVSLLTSSFSLVLLSFISFSSFVSLLSLSFLFFSSLFKDISLLRDSLIFLTYKFIDNFGIINLINSSI